MKVLVTGGSGFIGSHVVDRLTAHGHEPRIFDRVPSRHHAGAIETAVGDVRDTASVRRAARGCDAIVHLAAVADVDQVARDPSFAERVNVRGTRCVLEAAGAEGVRVVFASSIWVYGDATDDRPMTEQSALPSPRHFYTATKLRGERDCRSHSERYGIEHTILRFGIPHGPRTRAEAVVAKFVTRALAGSPLIVHGDGNQARQFVYVEDLADGIVASLVPAAAGRIYNLVGRENVSVREVADTVRFLLGDVPVIYAADRRSDLRRTRISANRAQRELGWTAATPFVDGVCRYIAWLTGTDGAPVAATASRTAGRAATVFRQEPAAL